MHHERTCPQEIILNPHDEPVYAVPDQHLIPVSDYPSRMMDIPPSRMFTIKEALKKYTARIGPDARVFDASQGDGGASLPGVPEDLLREALEIQIKHGTSYDQPFGTNLFRQVCAEDYWGLDSSSGWGPGNILFAQGGRDALNKAYQAMITQGEGRVGDLLMVSRVPWISYTWGPYGIGLNVVLAPGDPADGWRYTPEGIVATVAFAAKDGRRIAGMVITSPDNPTGRTIPMSEQIMLAKTALEAGVPFVLFDWIYHWVTDGQPNDINELLRAFSPEERERIMVLDGLTKSLGASNIRAAHLLAGSGVAKSIISQASHGLIPSFYAQAVSIAAYRRGYGEAARSILAPTRSSREVLRAGLASTDLPHIMGDGYYAFVDLTRYIQAGGFQDSASISDYLAEDHGVAVVPGVYFSEAGKDWIRFSYAQTPERTTGAFARLQEGLAALL
jgi:aspartate aminotransferase